MMKGQTKRVLGALLAAAMLAAPVSTGYASDAAAQTGYYSADLFGGAMYECDSTAGFAQFTNAVDTEVYHSGGSSVRLSDTASRYAANWMTASVDVEKYPVKAGDMLNLSLWVKKSLGTTHADAALDSLAYNIEFNFIDADGVEQTTHQWLRGGNVLKLSDTDDWQYLSENFTLVGGGDGSLTAPEGSEITALKLSGRFRMGGAGALSGNVWVDRISLQRAIPGGMRLSEDAMYEGTAGTEDKDAKSFLIPSSGCKPYTTVTESTDFAHEGTTSYKFTGGETPTQAMIERTWAVNQKVTTNQLKVRTSYWLKRPEGSAATARVFTTVYYIGSDGTEKNTLFNNFFAIANTTDWQQVTSTFDTSNTLLADMAASGGTVTKVQVRVCLGNSTDGILPDGTAAYVDEFETMLIHGEELVATRLISQERIKGSDGRNGVRLVFNDALMSKGSLAAAKYYINGEECTDYTLDVLADRKTADIYPAEQTAISGFGALGLKTAWGYAVDTSKVKDSINQDKFFESILPENYRHGDGELGIYGTMARHPYEVIKDADGNSMYKYNGSASGVTLFDYVVPYDQLGSMTDTFRLSFDIKKEITAEGAEDILIYGNPLTGFAMNRSIVYVDADGNRQELKGARLTSGDGVMGAADASGWQHTEWSVSMKDVIQKLAEVPETAKEIVGLYFDVMPVNQYLCKITNGNVYLDNISMTRVMNEEYTVNMFPEAAYECNDAGVFTDNGYEYKDAAVDTTVSRDGGSSIKLTGKAYDIYYQEWKNIHSVSSNKQKYALSFWIKKGENVTASNIGIWFNAYEKSGGAMNQQKLTVPLADTTEWQRVSAVVEMNYDLPESGGELYLFWLFMRLNDTDLTDKAVWVDRFELYKVPSEEVYRASRIESAQAFVSGGKYGGVSITFNSDFVTKSAVCAATVYLDGESAAFDAAMSEDGRTATLTFAQPTVFEGFEISGLTDMWGNAVGINTEIVLPPLGGELTATVRFEGYDSDYEEWTEVTMSDLLAEELFTKYRATVVVENGTGEERTVDAVLAHFAGNTLVELAAAKNIDTATSADQLVLSNNLTDASEVKVFVWDSLQTMLPVIDAVPMAK